MSGRLCRGMRGTGVVAANKLLACTRSAGCRFKLLNIAGSMHV